MAKLYFRHGAMNSGKSTALLQAAHNYEERGQQVLIAKPLLDTKGGRELVSRLGVSREVDFLVAAEDSMALLFEGFRSRIEDGGGKVACLLVDEAQFLTPAQVDDLLRIAVLQDIPVLCYGLRTDFLTEAFPGSARLLEVAHSLEELKTICRCGRKAMYNARRVGQSFIFSGEQISIDGVTAGYESLCPGCYLAESGGKLGRH